MPVGLLTLCSAERRLHFVDADAARGEQRSGRAATRTAYFCAPMTLTCATPLIMEMRCADQRLGVLVHGGERQRVGS